MVYGQITVCLSDDRKISLDLRFFDVSRLEFMVKNSGENSISLLFEDFFLQVEGDMVSKFLACDSAVV